MIRLEDIRENLPPLCRRYGIRSVDVFGSIARNAADDHSDIDLLIEFEEPATRDISSRYFGMLHELEDRFHRRIDLLTRESLHNPYLKRRIEKERVRVYGWPHSKTLV